VNLSKTSEGIPYSRIGTLLSDIGLLAIFVYQILYNMVAHILPAASS